MEEIHEAIVLCGKDDWKPTLEFGKFNLLETQLRWLLKHKFTHIIIASDKEYPIRESFNEFVDWSLEFYNRGTGGAVLIAADKLKTKTFYLMNMDDICYFYNPLDLCIPETQARILVAKPKINVGRVELRQDLVIGFKEKPIADYYCSVGHYFFKKHIVEQYFPDNGNLEDLVLPQLAKERILEAYKLGSRWTTIDTMEDYRTAKEIFTQ